MTASVPQQSFAAGELSPSLYARTDLAKYKSGAATMRNWFVDYRGGALTRPGTRFIIGSGTPGSGPPPRLVRFVFNQDQAYVLEFGENASTRYVRFYRNGVPIETSPGVPYFLVSPYALADLPLLKFTQSADVMTLTHPSYPVMSLKRFAEQNWTLTPNSFVPLTGQPTIIALRHTLSTAGGSVVTTNTTYRYVVTAFDNTTGEEGLPSAPASIGGCAAMSITAGESVRVEWTPVANCNTYRVYRQEEVPDGAPAVGSIYGLCQLVQGFAFQDANSLPDFTIGPPEPNNPFGNGVISSIAVLNTGVGYSSRTTVTIVTSTGQGFQGAVVVSGGHIIQILVLRGGFGYLPSDVVSIIDPGDAAITGASIVSGGQNYKDLNYWITDPTGYDAGISLGSAGAAIVSASAGGGHNYSSPEVKVTSLTGSGAIIALTMGTPVFGSGCVASLTIANPLNYPACSAYFVQRQWFAASNARPETFWASKIAAFTNFTSSYVSQATDAITATVASTQVNAIRCLVPMPTGLIAGTASGAFLISGGGAGQGGAPTPVAPSAITAQEQGGVGFSDVPPIRVDSELLFVQAKGSIVRDLAYNFYLNSYTGQDVTTLSSHLFVNRTIREWAYAEEPYKVVWCVRDDGILLGWTWNKPQEVNAWTRHDTQGQFVSVCTVPEGGRDATYFIVRRTLGGEPAYTIERMADRTLIEGNAENGTPPNMLNAWSVDCGLAYDGAPVTTVSGLDHLDGLTVSIVADGNVMRPRVVSDGTVPLELPASHVVVGLPFVCQLQTLNLDVGEGRPGGTIQGKQKKIGAVAMSVKDARGVKVGRRLDTLVPVKEWSSNVYLGGPLPLVTGIHNVILDAEWEKYGRVWVEVSDPVPASILGIVYADVDLSG